MHNRFKKLMKALGDGDISTARAEADRAKQSIDGERQPLELKLAALDEQQAWLDMTLKLHLPDETASTTSKATTYKSPTEVGEDGYNKKQRGNFIREAALALARKGRTVVSTDDVIAELEGRGIRFTIQRPKAAIGSTLTLMKEFERTDAGDYRYIGAETPADALPLMESAEAH